VPAGTPAESYSFYRARDASHRLTFYQGDTRICTPPSCARIRRQCQASRADIESITVRDLALTDVLGHRTIGPALGGDPRLSIGEKKRLGIAVQLVTKPTILLLDEPTLGLDPLTALSVMLVLKDIARTRGMIVLVSINQPSEDVLETFDDILLLYQSGR
jgi:ABC-type methionine transport system ATPase subunit